MEQRINLLLICNVAIAEAKGYSALTSPPSPGFAVSAHHVGIITS